MFRELPYKRTEQRPYTVIYKPNYSTSLLKHFYLLSSLKSRTKSSFEIRYSQVLQDASSHNGDYQPSTVDATSIPCSSKFKQSLKPSNCKPIYGTSSTGYSTDLAIPQ